jgi:anti-anti-sigma regulatory factor
MLVKSFDTTANRTIIFVGGEVDVSAAPQLYAEASRAAVGGRREVVVDLYNVTRLDVAAAGALRRAERLARRNGRSFQVECARGQPAWALSVAADAAVRGRSATARDGQRDDRADDQQDGDRDGGPDRGSRSRRTHGDSLPAS